MKKRYVRLDIISSPAKSPSIVITDKNGSGNLIGGVGGYGTVLHSYLVDVNTLLKAIEENAWEQGEQ